VRARGGIDGPSNDEMQRTRHGKDGGSPWISACDGSPRSRRQGQGHGGLFTPSTPLDRALFSRGLSITSTGTSPRATVAVAPGLDSIGPRPDDQVLCTRSPEYRREVAEAIRKNLPDACRLCAGKSYTVRLYLENDTLRRRTRVLLSRPVGPTKRDQALESILAILSMVQLPPLPFQSSSCTFEVTITH
jgi:hypothetical protein